MTTGLTSLRSPALLNSKLTADSSGLPIESTDRSGMPVLPVYQTRSAAASGHRPIRQMPSDTQSSKRSNARRRPAYQTAFSSPSRPGQTTRGALSWNDDYSFEGSRYFYEDNYLLKGFQVGQQVEITLSSRRFQPYLQLKNDRSGRMLLQGQPVSDTDRTARLVFTVKAGTRYRITVSTNESDEVGRYLFQTQVIADPAGDFNFFYGSGLVNAAAAVAQATGKTPFEEVADRGGDDWGLDMVKAPEAWSQGYTGQDVIVAVLDYGVDYHHPDLVNNMWINAREIANNGLDDDGNGFVDDVRGWDFMDKDNDPMETLPTDPGDTGHGTHVAGTIAASQNDIGITGVAYNAKIMPIRVASDRLYTSDPEADANFAAGIRYAVQNGARVINMSLGIYPGDPALLQTRSALEFAKQSGVTVIISSGNEREDNSAVQPTEPAIFALDGLAIAVGAVDISRKLADFSNPAGKTRLNFVVAPGVDIRSTNLVQQDPYVQLSGTSMASPHVAGVVALILSANPTLTPDQIQAILAATSDRQGIRTTV